MRVERATVFGLEIPFAESFAHGTRERRASDSIVIRLAGEDGSHGFGECMARPYVTGETTALVRDRIREVVWPALRRARVPDDTDQLLGVVSDALPTSTPDDDEREAGVVAHHASRCGFELALIDLALRSAGESLGKCLPPRSDRLIYSGVIGMSDARSVGRLAARMGELGLRDCKVKVGDEAGVDRVAAVREALGPGASIRVDANGVWTLSQAIDEIRAMSEYGIDCCEEPLGRERAHDLASLMHEIELPLLFDESLVTAADARFLSQLPGPAWFNLRVNKCGGLTGCLELAKIARQGSQEITIGSQVGETSILSAAGRHLAAHLTDHRHLEGSFGTLLLEDDIASPALQFGRGGLAPLLEGPGFGVDVLEDRLERYSVFREDLS